MTKSKLEKLFEIDTTKPTAGQEMTAKAEEVADELSEILGCSEAASGEDVATIKIDPRRVAKFNHFVQARLAKIYTMAERAAGVLVEGIEAGDIDGRSLDGTARILEAAAKSLSEMNQLNLLLHKQMMDKSAEQEIENLKNALRDQKVRGSRETILAQYKEIEKEKQNALNDIEVLSDAANEGKE